MPATEAVSAKRRPRRFRWLTPLVIMTITSIIVVSLGTRIESPSKTVLREISVRLLWMHQAQFAGMYAAKERGFYEDEGLNVSLHEGGINIKTLQLVLGGGHEFGIVSATDVIVHKSRGELIKSIGIIAAENPTTYFAKTSTGIRAVSDFRGKRIGIQPGYETEYYLRIMLRKAGVGENEVTQIPVSADMTPFFSGDVDIWPGYRINEPNIARERGIDVNEILPEAHGIMVKGDTIVATDDYIRDNQVIVEAFIRATRRGWEYARQNPTRTLDYVLKYATRSDRVHQARMLKSMLDIVFPSGANRDPLSQTNAEWEDMIKVLRESGIINNVVQADDVIAKY